MSQALVHRGPDGSGTFRAPQVALTMRRLSIIDPTTGWQPLYNEDGSLALVANGEIYNYVELREGLRQRGHRFRTGSDCEVIPHLYEEHGLRCVEHLRGMFAFALWDQREGRLLLARDRMGEKPLYLYEHDGLLLFGSELKTLLHSGLVPFRLDPRAVDLFFHFQYVPEPATPIQGVRKLPAAHQLTLRPDTWTIEERCYWRLEDAPPLEGDPAEAIRAELDTISGITLRSDMPVGVALSGGLDSSAIAVLAARKYPGTMQAFSVGYPGQPHSDERAAARALADHLNMPFHEIEVTTTEVAGSFPDLIRWQDDPIGDAAGFGYLAVSRAAREQGVPVLLQGQGGDELFWGYEWVRDAVRQSERKQRTDTTHRPRLFDYLALSPPRVWPRRALLDWALALGGLSTGLEEYWRDRQAPMDRLAFYDLTEQFRSAARARARRYHPNLLAALQEFDPAEAFTLPRPWARLDVTCTRLICQTYLQENGIAQGDRLSMASSVELRLPLVDYRLVETVVGLRKAHSDVHLPPKAWFREAVSGVVPDWVFRRPKRGFQAPFRTWHSAIFARHGHMLEDGLLVEREVLRREVATNLSRGHFRIHQTTSAAYLALALETWCREAQSQVARSMDGAGTPPAPITLVSSVPPPSTQEPQTASP